MNVVFRDPSGQERNIVEEELRELILTADERYWRIGSGEGSLEMTDSEPRRALTLSLKEPYGFLLQYGEYESTDDLVAVASTDHAETTEVIVGGNPWKVPTTFFVSRQAAWEAVEEFCRSGRPGNSLKWVRLDDQIWSNE